MLPELFVVGLEQGIILSIITVAIMIPFRLLDFPDLTAEGAYPVGGAVCTIMISSGVHPIVALICAALSSGLLGIGTAQVALRLKVNTLLAGIILSTMAYSINLRIMGKPNMSLFDGHLIHLNVVALIVILLLIVIPIKLVLHTEYGLLFRSIGLNKKYLEHRNLDINRYTTVGLFLAASLSGLAGGLLVQMNQFMDVNMGMGIVIHGLASLMLGEALVGNETLLKQVLAPVVGALIYQQMQGLVLSVGLSPTDLKLFTGLFLLVVIYLKRIKKNAEG